MSLADLSLLLEVPEVRLVEYESGAASIDVETLFGLVNALNIDPEDFLNLLGQDEIDMSSDAATDLLSLRIRAKLRT